MFFYYNVLCLPNLTLKKFLTWPHWIVKIHTFAGFICEQRVYKGKYVNRNTFITETNL